MKEEDILKLDAFKALGEEELQKLKEKLWYGSLAYILYDDIRKPLVHRIANATQLSFSETEVPEMNFDLLYSVLNRIFEEVKKQSIKNPQIIKKMFA